MYKNLIIFLIGFLSREIHMIMYFRIVLGFVPTFFTSKYSFSSGVGYVMRPILLITWTAFQSFILRDTNKNDLSSEWLKLFVNIYSEI